MSQKTKAEQKAETLAKKNAQSQKAQIQYLTYDQLAQTR